MDERKKGEQAGWPFVKMPTELLARLHKIAERNDFIPVQVARGKNPVKQGILKTIYYLVEQEEKREKRKEGKGE